MQIEISNERSGYHLSLLRHEENERGDVFTVKHPFKVRWNGRRLHVSRNFESDGAILRVTAQAFRACCGGWYFRLRI